MSPLTSASGEFFAIGSLAYSVIWLSMGLFLAAGALEWRAYRTHGDTTAARSVAAAAFVVFGLFWANSVPFFLIEHQSYVEGILALAALPLSVYAARSVYRGRTTLLILSRAIGVMGLIYLPFETIPAMTIAGVAIPEPRQVLIEFVAGLTATGIFGLGYEPAFTESYEGYRAGFLWTIDDGHTYRISVVLACTGIGSMAIFSGLIAAVKAPIDRKLRALAVSIPVIFVLNVLRTIFITVVTGTQSMHWAPEVVMFLFGENNPYRVSFLISDRILSQAGAVLVLMAIAYLVVRELPELLVVAEDVLYLITGEEHDLTEALDLPRQPAVVDPATRAD
ncbi:MAG: archaeosortase A [Halobacteriota archaeon]